MFTSLPKGTKLFYYLQLENVPNAFINVFYVVLFSVAIPIWATSSEQASHSLSVEVVNA